MLQRMLGVCVMLLAGCYGGAELGGAPPRSLAGTEVDGELRADGGVFVFDEQARLAFDYFLTAEEELSGEELDAWVRSELTRRVPGAVEEAMTAWQDYVAYRSAAAATLMAAGEVEAAERRMIALVEEEIGGYPIAVKERAEIRRAFALKRAVGLAGEEPERALAADEASEDAFLVGRRAVELARLAAAGTEEVQAVRTQHFGAEAAQRLAALDARRAAWDGRLAVFRGEREALLAGFVGTGAQREAAVAELEARHFDASEIRRVHALARIAGE